MAIPRVRVGDRRGEIAVEVRHLQRAPDDEVAHFGLGRIRQAGDEDPERYARTEAGVVLTQSFDRRQRIPTRGFERMPCLFGTGVFRIPGTLLPLPHATPGRHRQGAHDRRGDRQHRDARPARALQGRAIAPGARDQQRDGECGRDDAAEPAQWHHPGAYAFRPRDQYGQRSDAHAEHADHRDPAAAGAEPVEPAVRDQQAGRGQQQHRGADRAEERNDQTHGRVAARHTTGVGAAHQQVGEQQQAGEQCRDGGEQGQEHAYSGMRDQRHDGSSCGVSVRVRACTGGRFRNTASGMAS